MAERPETWAASAPDRSAVIDGSVVLSYRELNAQADRLADGFARMAPPRPAVAVRLRVRAEWLVVNLALAKLGWEHIAVSRRLTPGECAAIVADSGAALIVCDDEAPGELVDALDVPVVTIAAAETSPATTSVQRLLATGLPVPRHSSGPAPLVTYTSGTTGRPRGVRKPIPRDPVAARKLQEYLEQRERQQARFAGADRVLLTLPLHHGAGPNVALSTLGRGGTLYLLDRFDPVRVLELIQQHRINRWTTVPTMLHRIRGLPAEVLTSFDVSSIEWLGVGSAPVPMTLKEWVIGYFGAHCLVESYGASEVGMVAVMPPQMHLIKPGSCGRLRHGVEVRVVGPAGQPVPVGDIGELYVRTPLTISAYVNQSEPDEARTADGFFRIGDVGRLDADGYLYITGRIKDMIISGGVNIYPTEIEHVLVAEPGVAEAAVVGQPDPDLGEQVVAFCTLRPSSRITAEALLSRLAGRLAKFKIPRRIVLVDDFPRNAMGKVDKPALRRLTTERTPS